MKKYIKYNKERKKSSSNLKDKPEKSQYYHFYFCLHGTCRINTSKVISCKGLPYSKSCSIKIATNLDHVYSIAIF